jgi:K+-transporting ATPase ATPase C chain
VAQARGITPDRISELVVRHTEGRQWGVFGEPRVNVLLLNIDLDQSVPLRK